MAVPTGSILSPPHSGTSSRLSGIRGNYSTLEFRLSPVSKLLAELFKKQRVAAPRRLRDPAKTKKKLAGP
ncbi:hypothetical protein EYR41_010894 [Orbilia oligospora]|uniref:Uncharacterized protein n=1 Tax=Orbilia oligospora TaxID=2813651 RepID=A0A8H2HML6_ORBOL|nr:hypothetical protein EYR41_010894 [Orbilia oligospora]